MSSSFEMPQIQEQSAQQQDQLTQQEHSRLRQAFTRCKASIGSTALSLALAVSGGAVAGVAVEMGEANPPAAVAFDNTYPNMDAVVHDISKYEWWVDENADGKKQIFAGNDELQSPRGFDYRNCTDGVAYWVKEHMNVTIPGSWGSAEAWDTNAAASSVKAGNTNDIEPGDIAQSDDGGWGHVGLVTSVTKNTEGVVTSITTAELNAAGTGAFTNPTYSTKNASGNFVRPGMSKDWDHFIDVNGENKGLNNEDLASDPDGDGVTGTNDHCPTLAGPASNNGCPLPADADLDTVPDATDLAPFNPGPQANRGFPTHQRTVTGNFNGDGKDDLAIFYDYGNGHTRLWQFNGAPDGLVNSPTLQWDSQPGNWPAGGMKNAVADINADGYDDVVTFYDYGTDGIRAQGFYGTPNGLTGPQLRWYSGAGSWHWPAVHLVGGDFNGDGRGEIGAFYDYGNHHTKLWVFKDEGLGLEEGSLPAWDSGANHWSWIAMKNTVTDVNNDGRDDIVSLYDFGNRICTFVFNGSPTGITPPAEQPQWCSDPGTYWPNVQLVSGDFNGNGYGDVGLVYDYGNNVTRAWTMSGSSSGLTSPQLNWESSTWAWRASKWNTGDYNGDGKTDIGAFYDSGNSRTKHWVLYGTANGPSNTPAEDWDSGPGNPVDWWRF